jgi:hypothetical protein
MMLASRARRALRNVCAKNEFREPIQLGEFVQMLREKYLDSVFQKSVVCSRHSPCQEGRIAIVTNVWVGCGGREQRD